MKNNWQTKKLDNLVEVNGGGTPPTSQPQYFNGDVPWFTPSEITSGTVSVLEDSERQISEEAKKYTKIVDKNCILLSTRATIGNVAITSTASGYNQGIKGITPKKELGSWFLAYWLLANKRRLERVSYGTTFKELSTTALKKIKISFPSLEIQHKIVERLDAIRKLQELNQQEIEKAEELFDSFITGQLVQNNSAKFSKFGDIAEFQYGLTAEGKNKGNYRLIRITDINESGKLRNHDKRFVQVNERTAKSYVLSNDDLLVARTGATYGKFLLFDYDKPSVFASFLIRVKFNPDLAIPLFIWLFTRTEKYWKQARKLVTGSGQPQFNANRIKEIEITLPLLDKQKKIIVKAEQLLDYISSLFMKETLLNELFESTLNKAMKGELVS
ncbi:MAG TPA: restriction endonuclease subunit S [Candidatus Bathyarchaeia archaeon]|nr:restriction endonuclease subunit S [Candidatus Bathyarchaeia archaeon]